MTGRAQHHEIGKTAQRCTVRRLTTRRVEAAGRMNGRPAASQSKGSLESILLELWAGYSIVVDRADVEFVMARRWRLNQGVLKERGNGCHSLGRLLLAPAPKIQVMHINGDRSDFRRENLRLGPPPAAAIPSPFLGNDGFWRIPLGNGGEAIVDECDVAWLGQYRWLGCGRRNEYVRRFHRDGDGRVSVSMHREILGAPAGVLVDHANRNPLDNRRANLRFADAAQNTMNSVCASRAPFSGYRGVTQRRNLYRATLQCRGRIYRSRSFSSPEEAARAYDQLALKHHGEFAVLNFPEAAK